jgi:hypothetical protein
VVRCSLVNHDYGRYFLASHSEPSWTGSGSTASRSCEDAGILTSSPREEDPPLSRRFGSPPPFEVCSHEVFAALCVSRIDLGRPPSVFTAAKLMSSLIYRNKDNLMGTLPHDSVLHT